jgi:hypothetical protein
MRGGMAIPMQSLVSGQQQKPSEKQPITEHHTRTIDSGI